MYLCCSDPFSLSARLREGKEEMTARGERREEERSDREVVVEAAGSYFNSFV